MASSSLDPDILTSAPDRILGKGHGTSALGPSDTSDSGSDIQGAGLAVEQESNGFERDRSPDSPISSDTRVDSDTDSSGTGERASVEGSSADGADIDTDHIETVSEQDDEHIPADRP